MGVRSGFFNSRNGDRRYDAQVFVDIFTKLMTNGVYATPATSLQVQAKATPDMSVIVAAGFGMINGYYLLNDGDNPLTVATAHGTYARKDRVVARLNLTTRAIEILNISGTPAANPVPPLLVRDGTYYDLSLATITVSANATAIAQSDITDTRQNAAVCGTITGAVNSIDATNLFAQYEAQWLLLKALCEQDQEAILAQFASLNTVQKVNNVAPTGADKNVSLTLDEIPNGNKRIIPGYIQMGTATSSTNITIQFNKPYADVPKVYATFTAVDINYCAGGNLKDITNTGFTTRIYYFNGNSFANSVLGYGGTINWIAIGTLAEGV